MDLETVAYFEHQWDVVKRELVDSASLVASFIVPSGGLAREQCSRVGVARSRTGTAFSLHSLVTSGLFDIVFSVEQRLSLCKFVVDTLCVDVGPLAIAALHDESRDVREVARHLNEYSVPIWLSAIFVCLDRPELVQASLDEEIKSRVAGAVSSLAEVMKASGSLARVVWDTKVSSPSGYLTYWGANALMLASKSAVVPDELKSLVREALSATARWAEAEMTRLIACHHAGLVSKFDVVECISTAGAVSRLNRHLNLRPVDEVAQLTTHSMSLVLDCYFQAGSFRLSRPVFTDISRNTVICPTAESLVMLLSSLGSKELRSLLTGDRIRKIFEAFLWCKRNRRENGFPPDFDTTLTGLPEENVFSTSSTLAFWKLLSDQLDDAADVSARAALGVGVWVEAEAFDYPDAALGDAIKRKIIAPLTGESPEVAPKYSMILHGPPGTAKTSIAGRVAHDLKWPLKIITQSDFLKSGMDKIDAEADRIFTLCLSLKRVVILFDELEELILSRDEYGANANDRESRLLTTSMLPKIHQLRDRKRVVFIFATNRLKQIDNAATRLGRFDILFGVDYPSAECLTGAAEGALRAAAAVLPQEKRERAIKAFGEWRTSAHRKKLRMTFKDAQYCAECLVNAAFIDGKSQEDLVRIMDSEVSRIDERNKERHEVFRSLKESDRL